MAIIKNERKDVLKKECQAAINACVKNGLDPAVHAVTTIKKKYKTAGSQLKKVEAQFVRSYIATLLSKNNPKTTTTGVDAQGIASENAVVVGVNAADSSTENEMNKTAKSVAKELISITTLKTDSKKSVDIDVDVSGIIEDPANGIRAIATSAKELARSAAEEYFIQMNVKYGYKPELFAWQRSMVNVIK